MKMTSPTHARHAAALGLFMLSAYACAGPGIHQHTTTSPASSRAAEAPIPAIATSIRQDPLSVPPPKAQASHSHHQQGAHEASSPPEPKRPAAAPDAGSDTHGAGHAH